MNQNRLLRLVKCFTYVNKPEYGLYTNAANIMYLIENGAIIRSSELTDVEQKIVNGNGISSHYYFKVKKDSPLAIMIEDVYSSIRHKK